MKLLIRLEELFMLIVSVYALYVLNSPWWYYLLMFIGPDISMIGYVAGNAAGAWSYNLFHHKSVAVAVFIAGTALQLPELQAAGIILFGHSSMDRAMGYGLKFNKGFKYTHLHGEETRTGV